MSINKSNKRKSPDSLKLINKSLDTSTADKEKSCVEDGKPNVIEILEKIEQKLRPMNEPFRRLVFEDPETEHKMEPFRRTTDQTMIPFTAALWTLIECLDKLYDLASIVISYGDPGVNLVRQTFGGWNIGSQLRVTLRMDGHLVATETEYSRVLAERPSGHQSTYTLSINLDDFHTIECRHLMHDLMELYDSDERIHSQRSSICGYSLFQQLRESATDITDHICSARKSAAMVGIGSCVEMDTHGEYGLIRGMAMLMSKKELIRTKSTTVTVNNCSLCTMVVDPHNLLWNPSILSLSGNLMNKQKWDPEPTIDLVAKNIRNSVTVTNASINETSLETVLCKFSSWLDGLWGNLAVIAEVQKPFFH